MPSCPAVRQTSGRSPYGSAAATSSSRRDCAGNASSCRRKLSAIRSDYGTAPGSPPLPGQLRSRQPPRQFQQRQRVALRLGHDLIPDPIVDRPGQRRVQQRPRVALPQPPDFDLRQPVHLTARFPGREHQPDRIGGQPPCHEPQHLRGRLVQPLLVVDQADQRPFPGHLRQQAQYGQPDQVPVRRRSGGHAERDPQRLPLRYRQVPGAV
jgi:hypothetical protein